MSGPIRKHQRKFQNFPSRCMLDRVRKTLSPLKLDSNLFRGALFIWSFPSVQIPNCGWVGSYLCHTYVLLAQIINYLPDRGEFEKTRTREWSITLFRAGLDQFRLGLRVERRLFSKSRGCRHETGGHLRRCNAGRCQTLHGRVRTVLRVQEEAHGGPDRCG